MSGSWNQIFLGGMPRPAGRSPQTPEELDDALLAQSLPVAPPRAPGLRAPGGSGLPIPNMASLDPSRSATQVTAGGFNGRMPGRMNWDMSGGSPESLQSALAGLEKYEGEQFSPFSEFELSAMANRDPNTVAPGSNQVWGQKLKELQAQRGAADTFDRQLAQAPQMASMSLHPDVQSAQMQKAQADAFPQLVQGRANQRVAEINAASRMGAAHSAANARHYGDRASSLDAIMRAIQQIKGKATWSSTDAPVLRGLIQAYNDQAEALGLAGFEGFDEE